MTTVAEATLVGGRESWAESEEGGHAPHIPSGSRELRLSLEWGRHLHRSLEWRHTRLRADLFPGELLEIERALQRGDQWVSLGGASPPKQLAVLRDIIRPSGLLGVVTLIASLCSFSFAIALGTAGRIIWLLPLVLMGIYLLAFAVEQFVRIRVGEG